LSKYHPVGVMLYNSASFMSTPWETIIKVYRKQLGDRNFPTVREFQEDFIAFLRAKNFYAKDEDSKKALYELASTLLNGIIKEIAKINGDLLNAPSDENKLQILHFFEEKTDAYINQFTAEAIYCEDFLDYTQEDFQAFFSEHYEELITHYFVNNGYTITDELKQKFNQLIYIYLKRKETFTNFTGLIFTGFGDDEIYPSLIPLIFLYQSVQD
jgi:hypothetical protein